MGPMTPVSSRTSPCSCVFIEAHAFSYPWFAGIARYTARVALALSARVPVRFFDGDHELLPPPSLAWLQDQDLEEWGRQIWHSQRRPLGTPPGDSIGLYCAPIQRQRIFPYEVSILHDLCHIVVPWAFTEADRDYFGKFVTETLPTSDVVISVSRSTKADAGWFSSVDPDRVVVAYSGPSLCVKTHLHRPRVVRSDRIALVVSTMEPRKNAAFLFDWFQKTTLLPPDMELWWVGRLGWMISRDELERMANPVGGRRIRFLDSVSDGELCRLYQQASWSIYPSRYEGFGFPILDSLRHGTPVLASHNSSMAEFDNPGIFFFDPQDPATVDSALQRLQAASPVTIPQAGLDELYDWDHVAGTILDAHARRLHAVAAGLSPSVRSRFTGAGASQVQGSAQASAVAGQEETAGAPARPKARMRIGIEMFGTQSASRNRGIGRYTRNLVATMVARDPYNEYVLYCHEGLPTDHIPVASNTVTRPLRPDLARGELTLAHTMERLAETNPDRLDVLLLANPLEMALGFDLPAKPLSGLKMAAVVYDLIPLIFQEEYFPKWPGPEWVGRYLQGLTRLRSYDALLALSEATRNDFLSLVGCSPERCVTISAASNGRSFVPDRSDPMPEDTRSLLRVLGITKPFVFSVGDTDYRKNPWGLIDAFGMLPDELRRSHQLVLSYVFKQGQRGSVRQYAKDRGVEDALVLTEWLSDRALRPLYQRCSAFVFPSMYEGFGLPILEAMQCGAPVVVGNNSSQIEVVGDAGLLFNVADAGELATHLRRLLEEPDWARELGARAVVQARRFSWEATADRTLEILTGSHAAEPATSPRPTRRRAARRRIAVFSPLHPLSSEVADDSARLLEELKDRYTIDLYHDTGYLPYIGLQSPDFGCYDYRLFERNAGILGYHALLYQMGNLHYHNYMYDIMLRHPGIVTLHDLGLAAFQFAYAQLPGVDGDAHIRREFEAFCEVGAEGVLRTVAARAGAPGGMPAVCTERGLYLNARILRQATGLVVHSPWCVDQIRSQFPSDVEKVSVVAPGATALEASPEEQREIRARFGMTQDALIIASVGRIHPARMNVETVAAFAPLARELSEALLVFAGREDDQGEARREAMELGVQRQVRFLGHRPAEVVGDLAAIADLGVCLRRPPTGGESPAPLLDLLRLGVPTIVSDAGSFSCFPDSVVCKHRMETDGLAGLTRSMRELAGNRPMRETLGRAARQFVRQNHAWSAVADAYDEIIERAVAGRTGPRADGTSAPSCPWIVTSPEWLQAAS
jgi:glycosyltransferase involved in cell wall biosynthesis